MKSQLILLCAATALALATIGTAQTDVSPSPTPPASIQPAASPAIQGMGQMGDMESMKRMADMCQQMMKKEQAAMPFIIGTSVVFGVLLFVALLLLVVLEIQWIIYWKRLLRNRSQGST